MECTISVAGDADGAALTSLYRWLTEDPEVARAARVALAPAAVTRESMGGAFDVITAIVGNGIALGSLIVAYLSWRDAHPHRGAVHIERGGLVIRLDDSSPEDVSRIVEALSDEAP